MKTEVGSERGPSAGADGAAGVVGNARLTGTLGAVLFVLLAIEGVTILRVHRLVSAHVFVGMLVVPPVALKIGTTTYRFARYYLGDPGYGRRGAPPLLLRLAGPLVVVTSTAVLATGIAALAAGPGTHWLLEAHKASFILWFPLMTVHVLGHVIETPALALADWTRRARHGDGPARGAAVRAVVTLVTLSLGVVLAVLSLGWVGAWH
ncbi:MAG TPA: hypothetical protein VFC33_05770 [Acidimicrobiia bacterium]|nr:hypothetical protein [Acidimicrobiia bacterium]